MKKEAAYLQVIHGTSDGPLSDLVAISVQDGDNGTTLCGVDVLMISLNLFSPWLERPTLWACQAAAVGPVSLSPSPITATVIMSGLSMTLPYATARQYPSSPPSWIAPGVYLSARVDSRQLTSALT